MCTSVSNCPINALKVNLLDNEMIKDRIQRSEDVTCKWGRFICKPTEKHENTILQHAYAAGLNLKTGDIYLDCTKKKIYFKCCFLTIFRLPYTLIKTAYHLCLPLSISMIIYKAVKENQDLSRKELSKKMIVDIGRNFADIIRTPLYGIAMTIVTLTALIIGPFAPKQLYSLRATAGKIELGLLRQNFNSKWNLAPCFMPLRNINNYESAREAVNKLDKFGLDQIEFRRGYRTPFNDCFRLYPKDQEYASLSYEPIVRKVNAAA